MNFPIGSRVFYTHVFPTRPESNYIVEYEVLGYGKYKHSGSPCMKVNSIKHDFKSEISLIDCNIIPNTYNSHRLFALLEDAELYSQNSSEWLNPDNKAGGVSTWEEWEDWSDEYV